ncbi:HD domain-containing protein, partial [Candidatus Woesearchaeota archaeon]|nr:HD domain-containing protein [Candidatus Woesearchaeota archaeon]
HLARMECVDEEVTELAALLHDICRVKFGGKDHEITGIPEAEKILKDHNYPQEVIDEVKHCVFTHRASKDNKTETKIAEIIRDADAISHFDAIPYLLKAGLEKNDDEMKKTLEWLSAKLDRDWNNKMHLPESKRLVEEKYKAARLLIDATLDCFKED